MGDICATSAKKNLGKSKCTALPKLMKRMITLPDNFELQPADYATPAALKAKLEGVINAPINQRGYLWPLFSNFEDNSEEAVYVENALRRQPVRDGNYRYKPYISQNLCTHKAMFTHRAKNSGRVGLLDVDNQLFLTEPNDDGVLKGFTIGLLWTEKLRLSDGSNDTESPIILDLADNEEIDLHGVLIDGSVLNQIEPLTDVSITLTAGDAFAAAGFMVDVKQTCDGVPISGLVKADFLFYAADGITEQLIDTALEDANVPGRYNLVAPGGNLFESGRVTLVAPADLSIKAYEVDNSLAVVI